MNKREKRAQYYLLLRSVKCINIAAMTAIFTAVWYLFYSKEIGINCENVRFWVVLFAFSVLYILCGRIYEAFVVSAARRSEMVYSQCLALLLADGFMILLFCLAGRTIPSPVPMLAAFAAQLLIAVLWTVCADIWYYRTFQAKASVVVHDSRENLEDLIVQYGMDRKFDVKRSVTEEVCVQHLPEMLDDADVVFLCDVHSTERDCILNYCIQKDIQVYLIPSTADILLSRAQIVHMFHLPMYSIGKRQTSLAFRVIKRLFDIVASSAALLVLSPVMLVTAIAIKDYDGGPIFFRQNRLTKDCRIFSMLKFRSMCVDAEKDGIARLSSGDQDPRITPVGRIIRKTRIDELPQLVNIIKGDMSIVGPRPERPEIAQQYEKELPEFALRLYVKAGLTGYAQVYGKYNTLPGDKLRMDLLYISKASVWKDLQIIFATIKILFMKESTEGVQENQVTAMDE